jgi:hypothetical protein
MKNQLLLKPFLLVAALLAATLFTGCFRIVEKVDFKSMDSGTFTMITDLSTMYNLMAGMEGMGGEEGEEDDTEAQFQEMEDELKTIVPSLESISGIANVQTAHDASAYTTQIAFDFKSIDALNKGMSILYSKQLELEEVKQNTYFKTSKKKVERTDTRDMIEYLRKDMGEEATGEMAQFFQDASFELQYSFPKKVKKVSNKDYTFEKKSKNISMNYYMFREDFKEKPLGTTVKF